MGWVRLDDGFAEDPVIANLSDSALALWVAGIAYSNRQLTDGFIPLQVGYGGLRYCDGNAVPFARELERVGRWEKVDGGWKIHAYLEWQRSSVEILGERETTKERVERFRNAGGNAVANAASNGRGNAANNASKEPQPQPQQEPKDFPRFYAAFPRHIGRRAAAKAFTQALKRSKAKDIIEGAARLAADPNLPEERFIPYPATWLNRDGWLDDDAPARRSGGSSGTLTKAMDKARAKKGLTDGRR